MRDRVAIYYEKSSRLRTLRIAGSACCALLAGCGAARKEPPVEFSGELSLRGTHEATLDRPLGAGVWLVELRENEIDARATLDAGEAHIELADHAPRHGQVFGVITMSKAGTLRVQVRSTDHPAKQGSVLVSVAKFRGLDQAPAELEQGYVTVSAAAQESARGGDAALPREADRYSEAISLFEKADADGARGLAAYALANLQYYQRDDYAAAVRASETAADAFDADDDLAGFHNASAIRAAAELEIASAMNAGTQKSEQRALNAAADRRLSEAAAYFGEHRLRLREAFAVNMRGIRALNTGDYAEAGTLFARAVEMSRGNDDVAEMARSLNNLAWVHRVQGFVAQAAKEYEALMPLLDPQSQTYLYGVVLNNFGFCLIALGDFDRALALHAQALDLFTRSGNELERATELAAMGGLYFRIGDTDRALVTLRSAIDAQQKVSDTAGLASSLRLAGNAASVAGQHDLALEYLRRSASIDGNPQGVARTRVLIAGELRVLGDLAGSDAELAAALTSDNALVRANGLEERARLRLARRDNAGAIADLRDAEKQYRELSLDFNRIDTNAALAQALLTASDLKGASSAADEAVAIVRRIRVKSANPEWRARFLSSRYSPFEARIAVDMAAAPANGVAASWKAFRTAEEVRARSLSDQLAVDARADPARASPELDALRARLTSLQMRLESRMQRSDADEEGTLALRRDIEEIRAQVEAARVRDAGVSSGELELPAELATVQAKLPAQTVVLAYFVGDSQSHGWLLARDSLRHETLPGRESLQRAIEAALNPQVHAPQEQKRLGKILFGSLLDGVRETRMLVLADGPLNGVPFAALLLPDGGSQMLVDRFVVGYAPSLALAMQQRESLRPRGTLAAVVSDPVYGPDDRRLPAAGGPGNFRGPRQSSPHKLTRLPYSTLEARAVVKTFGAAETIELSGFDATPERVLQLPSERLAILHFATHAQARKDSPEQSALFLTEYSPDGALLPDSRVTANDITRHGLHADVVVLSGCATGDGSALRGEGVLGLTYGFLANGSRSVVATLWPVEDASTARFMNEFYRGFRQTGNAAEALRSAQLQTRAAAQAPVWSSFVVRANGFP
jgi:CHAT domain-containing protein/tetratricopeptide (TPR) repeat protein